MSEARWARSAQADFDRADRYHRAIDPAFSYRLGRAALDAAHFLAEHPYAGAALDRRTRRWRVRATSYQIIYRVTDDGGEIVRLRHAHENWRTDP